MSAGVVIVGSGASAVHFALTLLEQGQRVTMLDVGRQRPDPVVRRAGEASEFPSAE